MMRFFIIVLCILMLPLYVSADETPSLSLSAKCAVLIEAENGTVFYSKNSEKVCAMASTTKIMTAVIALEYADISKTVSVSRDAVGVIGSSVYLQEGEKITLENLLYAMLLESANDAAAAIAIEVAQSVDAFASLMNLKAAELGLTDTNFTNPHGLYDERHFTSAKSLALIAAYALKNEVFRTIVSTQKRLIPIDINEGSRLLVNHNKMLKIYDGAIGVKTGYTIKSGRCLVSAAERNGLTLIAVTLNAPDDWNDHMIMLNYGFNNYERVVLTTDDREDYILPVVGGNTSYVICNTKEVKSVVLKKNDVNITSSLELKRFYYAPIEKDERLGQIIFYNNGQEVARVPVIALNKVDLIKPKFNLLHFITGLFTNEP
ncbi:MAG: D-alanyl-D-alanine carboxypeptidase family protein [Eubacteriales bacterium]